MLDFDSLNALRCEPSANNHAIRLEFNVIDAGISGSSVTANALLLLRREAETGGLKLTATGNLLRPGRAAMCRIIEWPGYDTDELFPHQRVSTSRLPSPAIHSHPNTSREALAEVSRKAGVMTQKEAPAGAPKL